MKFKGKVAECRGEGVNAKTKTPIFRRFCMIFYAYWVIYMLLISNSLPLDWTIERIFIKFILAYKVFNDV